MASLTSRIGALKGTPHFTRLWKYASVSIISTLVTQVVLFLTYSVWKVGTAMESNVIATIVASVPAYYLNRSWTWGKSGRSNVWREVVPFWAISFVGLVLSTIAVGVAAHNADRITSSELGRELIVNFANLFTYGCIWVGRYFIFNRFLFGDAPVPHQVLADDESSAVAVVLAPPSEQSLVEARELASRSFAGAHQSDEATQD